MTIFKYLPQERIDILKNKEIRFTQPEAFNDPFESFPAIKQIITENAFNEHLRDKLENTDYSKEIDIEKIIKELPVSLTQDQIKEIIEKTPTKEIIKNILPEIIDFVKDSITSTYPSFMMDFSKQIKEITNKRFGVLSLTESSNNLIMWSHYAESHKGFLIGFNRKHKFFDQRISSNDQIRFLNKVHYSNLRPNLVMIDSNVDQETFTINLLNQVLFTKSHDWVNEREWRMILPLNEAKKITQKNNEKIYLFTLPPECITEIILGCKMNFDVKQDIINLINSDNSLNHIKIKQADLNYFEYSLSII